jgi:hypothetical protein
MESEQERQKSLCKRYGASYLETPLFLKIGINANFSKRVFPINGLRHAPEGDTSGWYIWSGQFSDSPDFFVPMHTRHLETACQEIICFLGLAPGWRFLLAPNHEDVWYDPKLLSS